MILKGKNTNYQLVIGLEIHAQVNTKRKLFSSSLNDFGSPENHNVNSFDIATPGTLPFLNEEVVGHAIRLGLAIDAKINKVSKFDRKNYFYPDQPSGYQITQFFEPILTDGLIEIEVKDFEGMSCQGRGEKAIECTNYNKKIRINRVHLEQDAGKLMHGKDCSLIDFNRAGVPLMEIVTEPDFRTINEVLSYLTELRGILRFTKVCVADLEKGTFRCDVNVSLMDLNKNTLGTRCEIKNLNSFKSIKSAIEFEVNRHFEILEKGELVRQETRLFDAESGETEKLRDKEEAEDYRYFPEPDLPPIFLTQKMIDEVKKVMPKLPKQKEAEYKALGLAEKEVVFLCSEPEYAEYFDKILNAFDAKFAVSWVLSELIGRLKALNLDLEKSPISSEELCELLEMIKNETINGKIAKDVLDKMIELKVANSTAIASAKKIVQEMGLTQMTNKDDIMKIISKVCEANQKQVQDYKNGNAKMLQFLIGMCMKESGGKVNPKILNEELLRFLDGR